jgi:hypothetical protein
MALEDSPMARTSEATTRDTRGAGSVYWTRPRSIIGAGAVEGLVCWLSYYTQGSDDEGSGRMDVLFPARSLVHFHGHTVKAQTLAWVAAAGLPFHILLHRLRVQRAQHLGNFDSEEFSS